MYGTVSQELRQRIKHLVYGHDRAVAGLMAESDAAGAAAAAANRRRLAEDYAERTALRALGREQVRRAPDSVLQPPFKRSNQIIEATRQLLATSLA